MGVGSLEAGSSLLTIHLMAVSARKHVTFIPMRFSTLLGCIMYVTNDTTIRT